MRVVINGWFWDQPETGSGQYVRRLAKALVAANPSIRLTILVPATAKTATESSAGARLRLVHSPTGRTDLRKLWWEQVRVPRLVLDLQADLLHIPYWAPPLSARCPIIVTAHDIIPLILPAYRGNFLVRLYTNLVSTATSRARLVLTDSEASRQDILRHLRLASDRVRTVPLAVGDLYSPDASDDDVAVIEALQLPEAYLLYLGGFDIRKNLRCAVRAFRSVCRRHPQAKLIVAGRLPEHDTTFTPSPVRLAREADLPEDAVRYLGFIAETHKPTLYRKARALIFPSRYEGFGYPVLEALACGTPVVASNTASLPEVVGPAGVLLDPDDEKGMATAMIQFLLNDAYHAEMSARAVRQSRRFSWRRTAQDTLACYREALEPTGPATTNADKCISRATMERECDQYK